MPYAPLDKTYPHFSQFFGNGYNFHGHDDYPIPVITSHQQGEWMDPEYKWKQT